MKNELNVWCQQHHCEALVQLAVHDGSREALLRNESVMPALEVVKEARLSAGVRDIAADALGVGQPAAVGEDEEGGFSEARDAELRVSSECEST
jgi:hypothetical protein